MVANTSHIQIHSTLLPSRNSSLEVSAVPGSTTNGGQTTLSGAISLRNEQGINSTPAVGTTGADTACLAAVKKGIVTGFAQAERAFGRWPDLSSDTCDAVLQKLDDWVAGSKAVA